MLLSLKNVKIRYGKAEIIQGITMEVMDGYITGLIGANGAGKSTIVKAVSGLLPTAAGEICFQNKKIDKMASHDIVRLGVIQVPERRRLFPYMTVLQNIRIGAYLRRDRTGIREDMERIFQRFPILLERRNQKAETLSGGEQQMLAIGRALMAKPKLLIMDEPSLGLAPLVVESLATVIREIHKEGIGVLLVEQNARLAFSLTNVVYVLEVGKVALEGRTEKLMNHEIMRKAFLGG
jgi:branched-chain amino acid transport system ATP-binding protein